ncbi:SDR family NAD(P)-dependent oxidoreductase [Pseudomonas sp. RP23018S]|uniref:SDR family NAD(P)-dependent oxidoreductase n=1 Tax=Pseudomonas sp. RP23018S TaxID=3096037 RepID=UPI002ACA2B02|nr:SDR family NAD(P)-dependent oxidoreductase [Pseudomonas sp. RP23018S]MDZ5603745.1 SDR family NAD(P)-dependent oxidoreductase [Pseudomonas sp. RP23018S]
MQPVMIVTGATRGIGAARARSAARAGYRVCLNYHRDEAAAAQVLAEVQGLGAEAVAIRAAVQVGLEPQQFAGASLLAAPRFVGMSREPRQRRLDKSDAYPTIHIRHPRTAE